MDLRIDPDTGVYFTDGSVVSNPGPGGWAWVRVGADVTGFGTDADTTNNRMELAAVIAAIEWDAVWEGNDAIEIYTDSQYVVNGFDSMCKGRPYNSNSDLWLELETAFHSHKGFVHIEWVRGHDGNIWNEQADELAYKAARGLL